MQLMRKACYADKDGVCQSEIFVVLVATSNNMSYFMITLIITYIIMHFVSSRLAAGDKSQITFVNLTGGGRSLFSGHVCAARQNKILLK